MVIPNALEDLPASPSGPPFFSRQRVAFILFLGILAAVGFLPNAV
jgi:hypothetical protein